MFMAITKSLLMLSLCLPLAAQDLMAPTKVGNGDNGADLEGFEKLESGPIVKARDLAIEKVRALNLRSIRGLGNLQTELEKSDLYITKKDINDRELLKLGAFESDRVGYIYARTFARPYAATRFFPVAKSLGQDQLVALHIHEALHRSLPQSIREDEKVVSAITLEIVNPDANRDDIEKSIASYMPKELEPTSYNTAGRSFFLEEDMIQRNVFEYSYGAFFNDKDENSELTNINEVHHLSSKLYPFGGSLSGTGLGLSMGWYDIDSQKEVGPLSLSLQHQLVTSTRFRLFGFIEHSIAPTTEMFEQSSFNRDLTKLGLKMYSFKNKNLQLINSLVITVPSSATDKRLSTPVVYDYGFQYHANATLRGLIGPFGLGGFLDYAIAEERTVTNGSFQTIEDREALPSVGIELGYFAENFNVKLSTRKALISDSQEIDYSRFGDIKDFGVGDQNLKLGVSVLW